MAARSEASTRSDVSAPMNLHDFVIYIVVVEVEFLPAAKQRRSMDHNWPRLLSQSSQESIYRPEKHGNIGN